MALTSNLANRSRCRLSRIFASQHMCLWYSTNELQNSQCKYCDVVTTNLQNQHRRSFHNLDCNLSKNLPRCFSSQSSDCNTQESSAQTTPKTSSTRPLEASTPETSPLSEARLTSEATTPDSSEANHSTTELFFYGPCCSVETKAQISLSFLVLPNFITADEEDLLLREVEPHLKRLRYEVDHWDDAIVGFRETEVGRWSSLCSGVLQRHRNTAFGNSASNVLVHTHILDLAEEGHIKPHVDSIKFCGSTISGLSLGSAAVMRLVREGAPDQVADIVLPRCSLYIMRDASRYHFTHEVLNNSATSYVPASCRPHRMRRVSVICRNQPA